VSFGSASEASRASGDGGGGDAPAGEHADRVELVVPPGAGGVRLDRYVATALGVSRAEAQRWIAHGRVTLGGAFGQPSASVRPGDPIVVRPEGAAPTAALPDASVEVRVLHVDDHLVVIDKPAGLVVHPAKGHPAGTLVNGLLALGLFGAEPGEVGEGGGESFRRPGIVHRLDRGTTGVMVVARTSAAREALKAQFQAHTIERAYRAIVVGEATPGTYATLHGRDARNRLRFTSRVREGRRAVTHVRVVERLAGATLVECTLETGRTHQIRMHLSESGTPVLGDRLYGRVPRSPALRDLGALLGHQALHAGVLGFVHPATGKRVRFTAPPPADFLSAMEALRQLR
jgi:23S rRNA pseudouridine1911/1915/1917 synthase